MPDIVIEANNTLEEMYHRVPRFVRWINTSAGTAVITFTTNGSPLANGSMTVQVNAGKTTAKLAILPAASGHYPYQLSVSLVGPDAKKKDRKLFSGNGEVIIDG